MYIYFYKKNCISLNFTTQCKNVLKTTQVA